MDEVNQLQGERRLTPSMVGLAINYTLLVPVYLNWVVRFLADTEMCMGAVERVQQYAAMPTEEEEQEQREEGKRRQKGKNCNGIITKEKEQSKYVQYRGKYSPQEYSIYSYKQEGQHTLMFISHFLTNSPQIVTLKHSLYILLSELLNQCYTLDQAFTCMVNIILQYMKTIAGTSRDSIPGCFPSLFGSLRFHYQQSCHGYMSNVVCCIFFRSAKLITMTRCCYCYVHFFTVHVEQYRKRGSSVAVGGLDHCVSSLPSGWPLEGKVEFRNVSLSHHPVSLPPVLTNVTLTIAAGEKVSTV